MRIDLARPLSDRVGDCGLFSKTDGEGLGERGLVFPIRLLTRLPRRVVIFSLPLKDLETSPEGPLLLLTEGEGETRGEDVAVPVGSNHISESFESLLVIANKRA